MKLPDIPAIVMGGWGLLCLTHVVELPDFVTGLADNAFVATCLEGIAKYPEATTVCLYLAAGVLLISGILRIWLDASTARYLWGVGSGALAVLLMIMLNETVFGWAWYSDLYSAGTTQVVLTVFHFCWVIACPLVAFYVANMVSDSWSLTMPDAICEAAMPFWVIPVCAVGGFLLSLVPYAALLLVLIPLNYVLAVVDAIFLVLAFLVIFLLLKFGIIQ